MPVDLIKMTRPPEAANGGPLEADVHPDEVDNYALGGFVQLDNPATPVKLTAANAIAAAAAAETTGALDALEDGETRSTVLTAIAKRRAELAV